MVSRISCATGVVAAAAFIQVPARAAFLDLGGPSGGTLDGVDTSFIFVNRSGYQFNNVGTDRYSTTVNDSSHRYRDTTVYDPAAPNADRVAYQGLINAGTGTATARFVIAFGQPMTDLRFHIADMQRDTYTFSLVGGLTGVALARGNGGNGDGLQVVGNVVSDADPATGGDGSVTDPDLPPPTSGPRGAFGSVSLNGTYSSLVVDVRVTGGTAAGSFTLSSVPEPTAVAALGVGGAVLLRRRRKTN